MMAGSFTAHRRGRRMVLRAAGMLRHRAGEIRPEIAGHDGKVAKTPRIRCDRCYDFAMLSQRSTVAVKQDYDRDGFVILRGYLEESELTALRERAERLANDLLAKKRAAGEPSG